MQTQGVTQFSLHQWGYRAVAAASSNVAPCPPPDTPPRVGHRGQLAAREGADAIHDLARRRTEGRRDLHTRSVQRKLNGRNEWRVEEAVGRWRENDTSLMCDRQRDEPFQLAHSQARALSLRTCQGNESSSPRMLIFPPEVAQILPRTVRDYAFDDL